ncbi:regulator of nonsense transcripts 1-like protein [Iris pallida]|uniref:Regulator of nonsense transcripts 1-like protein n=1 Tax=Iris pallida TaxID=29817 RepID=A0AAX6E1F1_IRIPA|nr:regulator of nonsense transcripts 1-like protein [Iris pallida]
MSFGFVIICFKYDITITSFQICVSCIAEIYIMHNNLSTKLWIQCFILMLENGLSFCILGKY